MSKLKILIKSFGVFSKPEFNKPHSYKPSDYANSKEKKLELHKTYLKEIAAEESNRLSSIENKTSQIITQTGLVFSLLSLFIPFIIDKVLDLNIFLKALFILVLVFAYLFYILTISNALKNFNVKKFNYIKNSPSSVLNKQELSIKEFMKMEIEDSLLAINNNISINNVKATNLIFAHNSFKFGNIFTSILVVLLCASLLFMNPEQDGIKIENEIEIKQFEEYIETLKEQNEILKQRLRTVKIDTVKINSIIPYERSSKSK